ncbi:MAG: cysteine hydrolase [Lachnospiraceae bacterium]|nr:cysteine hydrolase [Lachnospiraceae bacterium]
MKKAKILITILLSLSIFSFSACGSEETMAEPQFITDEILYEEENTEPVALGNEASNDGAGLETVPAEPKAGDNEPGGNEPAPEPTLGDETDLVLLIIDIQNDYFEGGKHVLYNPLDALANAELLLNEFRERGLPVIHVQHHNSSGFLEAGTFGAKIHEDLTPLETEFVITKREVSSFLGTNLEAILTEADVKGLLICGMQTNVCVQTTAKRAVALGFDVIVAEDAAAALNSTAHDNAVESMLADGVSIIKTNEFEAVLEKEY